jgi:hypothetical protein
VAHKNIINLLHTKLVQVVNRTLAGFDTRYVFAHVKKNNGSTRRNEDGTISLAYIDVVDLKMSVGYLRFSAEIRTENQHCLQPATHSHEASSENCSLPLTIARLRLT